MTNDNNDNNDTDDRKMKYRNNRISEALWFLFLLSFPFQTRLIVGEWQGEWASFALYGSDVLLVATVMATRNVWCSLKTLPGRWLLLAVGIVGFVSLAVHDADIAGIMRLLFMVKIAVAIALARVWFARVPMLSWGGLVGAGIIQAVVAIGQFVTQQDRGLWLLGETVLRTTLSGVATVPAEGVEFLRAYGTTPHPNILGAVLMVSLLAVLMLHRLQYKTKDLGHRLLVELTMILLTVALVQTFSRVALAAVIGALATVVAVARWKGGNAIQKLGGSIVIVIVTVIAVLWPLWQGRIIPSMGEQAVTLRVVYMEVAGEIIREYPLLGVGPGKFVTVLQDNVHTLEPWAIQPVHSFYLLLASEMGLVTLGLLILLFITVVHHVWGNRVALIPAATLLALLGIGTFDHFFLTTQQGALLFGITIGALIGTTDNESP